MVFQIRWAGELSFTGHGQHTQYYISQFSFSHFSSAVISFFPVLLVAFQCYMQQKLTQLKQILISFSPSHSHLRAHTLRLGLLHLPTSPLSSSRLPQLSLNSHRAPRVPVRHTLKGVALAHTYTLNDISLTLNLADNGEAPSSLSNHKTQAPAARAEAAMTRMRPAKRACAHCPSVDASSKT